MSAADNNDIELLPHGPRLLNQGRQFYPVLLIRGRPDKEQRARGT
jgi:hypothetical protein